MRLAFVHSRISRAYHRSRPHYVHQNLRSVRRTVMPVILASSRCFGSRIEVLRRAASRANYPLPAQGNRARRKVGQVASRTPQRNEFAVRSLGGAYRFDFLSAAAAPVPREVLATSGCRIWQLTEIGKEFTGPQRFFANIGNRVGGVPRLDRVDEPGPRLEPKAVQSIGRFDHLNGRILRAR